MDNDAHEERFKQHKEMIQGLARIWERHGVIIEELREFNRQQVAINQRLEITQARVESLLARMIRQGENGQEA